MRRGEEVYELVGILPEPDNIGTELVKLRLLGAVQPEVWYPDLVRHNHQNVRIWIQSAGFVTALSALSGQPNAPAFIKSSPVGGVVVDA